MRTASAHWFHLAIAMAMLVWASWASAHFQVLLPSDDIVSGGESKTLTLSLTFTHPMEQGPVMAMGQPAAFGVLVGGGKHDLLDTLKVAPASTATAYTAIYNVRQPGDYVFFIEPAPYWEAAEEKMIVHYTKVVVSAFDAGEGWDASVGFPVEIEPLSRPYGLWTGNVFRGVVRRDGQPVPNAAVEVEYLNESGRVAAPSGPFITQVVKADANGVFAYAMPRAGWWGFAALVDGEKQMPNPDGKLVDVELGGLIWVKATDMK